jgi:hypothetical protein
LKSEGSEDDLENTENGGEVVIKFEGKIVPMETIVYGSSMRSIFLSLSS